MAYDRDFLKVTWGFTIQATDEIAMTSLNLSSPGSDPFDADAALAEIDISIEGPLLLTRMAVLLSSTGILWANYSQLRTVRIAAVTAAGPEVDPAKLFEDSTPALGGAANVVPQESVVGSLRSGLSSGSANFGRMYIPHTSMPLTTGAPTATGVATDALATDFRIFVNGVRADIEAAVTQTVVPKIMTQVAAATSKTVTQIAIGDVVDTQRRRRNQLPETYVFRSVPA